MKRTVYYYVAIKDSKSELGYKPVSNIDEFLNREDADIERIYLQPDYEEKLEVLQITCEVL